MSAPFDTRLPEEGEGLVAAAQRRGVTVRLMGGVGIRLLLGERCHRALERPYRDLDVIVRRRDARELEAVLADRGWDPAVEFNALNGARRLLFHDPASDAQVDVFVEAFEMCHRLPLADSLDRPGPSLPATDLLMSKLQIVSLNAKDRGDCYALLLGCPVAEGDAAALEPGRLAALTGEDWGLHHTLELNLGRLHEGLGAAPLADAERATVRDALAALERAMEDAPKSRGWRLRARIGERKRWYDEPEEVDRAGEG
jgi:hypothetical protein